MHVQDIFRHLVQVIAAALVVVGASACSRHGADATTSGTYETLELRHQGNTGIVSFPELAEDLGYLAPIKLKYIGNTTSGPQDIQTVVTGDADFGVAFNGAILKLIAARAPITAVIGAYGVDENTWSGFYVLQNSPIKTARDLIGKKVAVNTLGAHSEFVLREYLARNGLTPDEAKQVTLVVIPPVSSEQTLRQGQVDVATLGSVIRDKALERGGIRPLFTDFELYGSFTAGSYVVTNKFLKDNPNTVRKFVDATAKAIEWARSTPREQVIARYEQIINRRGRNEDVSLAKYWRSTGIAGQGGKVSDREFQVWIDWMVKAGELKPDQIKPAQVYTNAFNPYSATTLSQRAEERSP